jgi:hypothetical protein
MGLETPLALLGLLALALPWLAHRIRRRDLAPVPLPTFALLRQAEAKKRRSRGLTDLILLALRIAIVATACLGIAAPFAVARLSFGDGTTASAAIVIDDSMSMMRRDGGDDLLALSVERARQAIESLPQGSEVALIAGGKPARVIMRRTTDLTLARLALDHISDNSVREADLAGATRLAVQQLAAARNSTRRVLLISDFAKHTGLSPADLKVDGTQITLQRMGAFPPPANLFVSSVRAVADPGTQGQTSVAVELGAYGEVPGRVPVSVLTAGHELARADVQITAGRGRATLLVPTPEPDADPTAEVRIAVSDAIDLDNRAGVLLRPSDALQVMLVNGDPSPGSNDDELHYAQRALRLAPSTEGTFSIRTVDANTLAKYDLTRVDVLVLANVSSPDRATAERIVQFVQAGGGLIVTGGDNVQPKPYEAALSDVLPCKLRARALGSTVSLAPTVDGGFLPAGPSGLLRVTARGHLVLDCDAEVYLRFSDGSVAIAAADFGLGRSAILATTLDTGWSDLPLRPGYLPLLTRLIRNVAHAGLTATFPVAAGASLKLGVPPGAVRLEVVTPEGVRHAYGDLEGKDSVTFDHTQIPGSYRVLAAGRRGLLGDVPRGAFVVASPLTESELSPLPDIDSLVARGSGRTPATTRHALTPLVLLLFGALVFAEGVVRAHRAR